QQRYEELTKNPLWQKVPAVQNGKVFIVPSGLYYRGDDGPLGSVKVIDDIMLKLTGAPLASAPPARSATRSFTDAAGRSMEIPTNPQRIVVLNDSNGGAQILALGGNLAGMTTRNGTLELADRYNLSGVAEVGDYNAPNLEQIAALNPDLIVNYTYQGEIYDEPDFTAKLEAIAPVVYMETGASVAEVMAGFADLLGAGTELDAMRSAYEARLAEVRTLLPENLDDVTISVIQMQDNNQINTFGRGWFSFGEVFEDLSFTSYPANQASGPAVETCCLDSQSLETLPEFDGDVIFYYVAGPNNDYSGNPLFQNLNAVKADQAFEWNDDWWGNSYDTLGEILTDLEQWFSTTEIDPAVYP
ncbi:MAG: ABC transporter substrate-binding protein, partial [Chloroflexales bacterium]|nr:ABC transporter substrate-binding protein [Chloroflexales bacterium]